MAVSWLKFLFGYQHKYSNSTWVVLSKGEAAESLPLPNHHGFGPSPGGPPPRPSSSSSSSQPSHQSALMPGELKTIDCEDSSSLLPSEVTQQQLSVQQEMASGQAVAVQPSTRKSIIFPPRPSNGNAGVECVVKANHFLAEFQFPDKDLYQYDVTITPEVVTSCVKRAVMEQLVELYKVSHFGQRLPAYDGRKSLYTAGPLPFLTKEFTITLLDDDGGGDDDGLGCPRRREREFKVVIELAAFYDLDQANACQQALHQLLNTVLQQLPITRYCLVGRSFCSPNFGRVHPLGKGLESWRGFYQSICPTQMGLSLNIDVSSNAFMKPLPVIEFVILLLNRDDSSRPLSDDDCLKIEKALRGVKVEVTHRGKICRKYRIFGLTSQATQELMFSVDDSGTMKSVVEYFREKYGLVIRYIRWPCLKVGNQQMPIYLPMEVCKIVEGQSYSERLDESQITALRNVTCQRPEDREHDIIEAVHHKACAEDPYVKEFGIKISENPVSVEARILPAPLLKFHDTGREKDCLPQVGQWNMRNKKMVNGGAVNSWVCINLTTYVLNSEARRFCHYLGKMCAALGMAFNPDPVLPFFGVHPERVESGLKDLSAKLKVEELDLLIAIIPHTKEDRGSVYGDLKRICETELGIVSQCCLSKHVHKMSLRYLENVALKINVKVGGRNTVLVDALSRRLPLVSDRPTIIFGADVNHPHPGEDSSSPSIAAVVASQDWPEITKYASLVSAQAHRQELIQDLFKSGQDPVRGSVNGGMIRELLISFYRATGHKPQRIIFYRDGVSESQFHQVLLYELDAIHKACASIETNYQPPVTFVLVQKRHHTRLFADNHSDTTSVDSSGNILPGTVVDSKICHPTGFDFYLCSHASIQGTSRPTHYHVLWDENKFTAAALQSLTNNLCYTYARCTRSVSIVPPVYYAHIVAFRARFYLAHDTVGTSGPFLRAVKENLRRTMYYC